MDRNRFEGTLQSCFLSQQSQEEGVGRLSGWVGVAASSRNRSLGQGIGSCEGPELSWRLAQAERGKGLPASLSNSRAPVCPARAGEPLRDVASASTEAEEAEWRGRGS